LSQSSRATTKQLVVFQLQKCGSSPLKQHEHVARLDIVRIKDAGRGFRVDPNHRVRHFASYQEFSRLSVSHADNAAPNQIETPIGIVPSRSYVPAICHTAKYALRIRVVPSLPAAIFKLTRCQASCCGSVGKATHLVDEPAISRSRAQKLLNFNG
jgi:hypothetical protein